MGENVIPLPRVADEERCWQAVLARGGAAAPPFVWAVRGGGVYCLPSCPSPRPRRDAVVFFPLPEVAEQAGLRPCRRCRPERAAGDPHAATVRAVCRYVEANLEGPLGLDVLGREAGLSPQHLQRVFKRITGITPRQYADACRLGRLKAHLRENGTVTTAMYAAGYGSSSRLYERASAQLGMTPATYKHGGRHVRLRYTVADSPLGRLLLAATDRGISALYLGDAVGPLEAELRREFPAAELARDDAGLGLWLAPILEHLRGRQPHLDLPLDVRATAFQWRVWQELQAIPYGSTRTYREVAEALGQPSAVRAVARACATNPVSVVIPCHRVVRGDGSLAGYRWGLGRKRQLLDREKKGTPPEVNGPGR
jgi:AraC family transcriptional regulator of adaptative response/methylated-DNA-[protein]-cysteine methyltransferase